MGGADVVRLRFAMNTLDVVSSNSSGGSAATGGPSVGNLFPAIAQSFAVILIGYLFGLFKIIPPGDARAISELVGKLALPALLFQNLAILDLSAISWGFMGGILIAKTTVFVVTVVLTLILTRPLNIGKAGLYGIFTTQSNDFALGLPIVQALYGTMARPHQFNYVSYIYLLAPISLAIINPIGFIMMEYWKQSHRMKMTWKHVPSLLLKTLRGVAFNPVIFMTALGVVYNLIVHFGIFRGHRDSTHNIPSWLGGFLSILGGAYAACALFQIGIFMVGKLMKVTGMLIMTSALLIFAKTILLPMVADQVLSLLMPHGDQNATRDDISTYGFLYGTFPTAPTVFVFASQYNLAMEIVAASIVLCTFMSAPLMYISARLVLIPYSSEEHYSSIIENTRRDVTIIALLGVIWVFFLFLLARRFRSYLHVIVMHLMVAQILEVVGGEVLDATTKQHQTYWQIFSFALFFPGVMASRIWTAWLAVALALLLIKGPRVAEKAWLPLMLSAWGIPILTTVIMVIVCTVNPSRLHEGTVDVSFLFGKVQLVVSAIVLVFSFVVGVVFTIVAALTARKQGREGESSGSATRGRPVSDPQHSSELQPSPRSGLSRRTLPSSREQQHQVTTAYGTDGSSVVSPNALHNSTRSFFGPGPQFSDGSVDVHPHSVQDTEGAEVITNDDIEIDETSNSYQDRSPDSGSVHERTPLLATTQHSSTSFGILPVTSNLSYRDTSGKQVTRFIVLLMFLLFSCLVGILIVIWKLNSAHISGIFIGVNVLDTITNFGQGFFVFIVFGFEKHWFWMIIYNRVRKVWFQIERVELPLESDLSPTVTMLCGQFRTQHLNACKAAIVSDKRYYLRVYESVFTGSDFVDWLVDNGLVRTRADGVQYGHHLLQGRVLTHVTEEHYFYDDSYFYRFCE